MTQFTQNLGKKLLRDPQLRMHSIIVAFPYAILSICMHEITGFELKDGLTLFFSKRKLFLNERDSGEGDWKIYNST